MGTRQEAPGAVYNVVVLPLDPAGGTFTLLIVTETGGARSVVTRLPITVDATAQASGNLQFTLTWERPVDLDLRVTPRTARKSTTQTA